MAVRTDAEFVAKLKATDEMSGPTKKAEAATVSLSVKVTGLNQALELARKAWSVIADPVKDSVAEFKKASDEQTRLINVLRLTGDNVSQSFSRFIEFSDAMQATTTVSGGLATTLLTTAKTMGLTNDEAEALVRTAADLATVTGKSVEDSFQGLVGTMNGNARGLGTLRGLVADLTEEQLRAGGAVKRLGETFAGQAAAGMNTFGAQAERTKNLTDDLKESVGLVIVETINLGQSTSKVNGIIAKTTKFINENKTAIVSGFKAIFSVLDDVFHVAAAVEGLILGMASRVVSAIVGLAASVSSFGSSLGIIPDSWSSAIERAEQATLKFSDKALGAAAKNWKALGDTGDSALEEITSATVEADSSIKSFGKGISRASGNVKKLGEDGAKAVEELRKKLADLTAATVMVGATEAEQIAAKGSASQAEITALENRIKTAGKLGAANRELIAQAREQAGLATAKELGVTAAKNLAELTAKNTELLTEANAASVTELSLIDAKTKAEVAALQAKMASLALDPEGQKALADQVALIQKRAEIEKEAAATGMFQKYLDMREELIASGKTEEEQIIAMRDLELQRLAATEARLKAEGQLTPMIEAQLAAAREIIGKSADKKLGETKDKKDEDTAAKVKAAIIGAFSLAASGFVAAMKGGFLEAAANTLGAVADMPQQFLKAMDKLDQVLIRFVSEFPNAVKKIVEKLPEVIQRFVQALPMIAEQIGKALPAIAKSIADAAPDFIAAIMKALPQIIQGLADALSILIDAIPEIVNSFVKNLPAVISKLFEAIPQIFASIFKMLPQMFENLAENVDEFVLAFVQGFIEAIGDIVIAFVDEMILGGGIERIVGAFIRSIPRIVVALVQGIARGLYNVLKRMFGGGQIKAPKWASDLPKDLEKAGAKFAKQFKGGASKLFEVKDLTDAAKGPADTVKNMAKEVEQAFEDGVEKAKGWWQEAIDALLKAWREIWGWLNHWIEVVRGVFNTLTTALGVAWHWVLDNIVDPLVNGLTEVWNFVYTQIVGPLVDGLTTVWLWVDENIVTPLEQVGTKIWDAIKSAFDVQTWTNMGNSIMTALANLFNTEKWTEFGTKIKDAVGDLINLDKWKSLGSGAWDGFTNVAGGIVEKFKEWGSKIWSGFWNAFGWDSLERMGSKIWKGFEDAVNAIWGWFADIGDKIWAGLFDGIRNFDWGGLIKIPGVSGGGGGGGLGGALKSAGSKIGLASGGPVPAAITAATVYAASGAFAPRVTDTVPAMLTPGEFVMSAGTVRSIGVDTMRGINATRSLGSFAPPSQGGVVIEKIEINARTNLDADGIRREVWPEIERQLKRRSQDGQRLLDPNGVR